MAGWFDTLKSAASNLASEASKVMVASGVLGDTLQMGSRTIAIGKLLADGGYAMVYLASDANTGEEFALKKMICHDRDTLELAVKEASIMKKLADHPNVVRLHEFERVRGQGEAIDCYFLMDLCKGGTLFDLMTKFEEKHLNTRQVRTQQVQQHPHSVLQLLQVSFHLCRALSTMHQMDPPIAHRDIKLELDRKEIMEEEEQVQKYSTEMYCAPEMCDLYAGKLVNEKVDVWAVGALIYTLAYWKHPFQIVIPAHNVQSLDPSIPELIKWCLTVDPQERPSMQEVVARVQELLKQVKGRAPTNQRQQQQQQHAAPASSLEAKLAREVELAQQRLAGNCNMSTPSAPAPAKRKALPKKKVPVAATKAAPRAQPKAKPKPAVADTSFDDFGAAAFGSPVAAAAHASADGFADFSNFGADSAAAAGGGADWNAGFGGSSVQQSNTSSSPGFADFGDFGTAVNSSNSPGFADFGTAVNSSNSPGFADFGAFGAGEPTKTTSAATFGGGAKPANDDIPDLLTPSHAFGGGGIDDLLSPSGHGMTKCESLDDLLN